jgi:hypothetical protein
VIYRLKEGNSIKWLFSSNLTVHFGVSITPERNAATGLVIAPPVWELTGFKPQNTSKSTNNKHQNGHLPGAKNHSQSPATDPGNPRSKSLHLNCRKICSQKLKASVNPGGYSQRLVSRKCHFAMTMTQAFLGQAGSTVAPARSMYAIWYGSLKSQIGAPLVFEGL